MGCCGSKDKDNQEFIEKLATIPIIWVLGGPGSGKGTQCQRLVEKYGFIHLSSGDLLRAEVESGSKKGEEISNIMIQGDLVSRDLILDLVKQAMINNISTAKGFLIDGFPREIAQAQEFESKIYPCTMILYFDCSDGTMKERLMKRGQGPGGRMDDNEKSVMKRLKTFHTISEPVMARYNNKVTCIPADTDPDSIFEATCAALDSVLHIMS